MKRVSILTFIIIILSLNWANLDAYNENAEEYLFDLFDSTGANMQAIEVHIEFNSPESFTTIKDILGSTHQGVNTVINSSGEEVHSLDISIFERERVDCYLELKRELERRDIDADYYFMVEGTLGCGLNKGQMIDLADLISSTSKLKNEEFGFVNDYLISISGYTSEIPEYIKTGGKKVNINAAIRSQPSSEDSTIIIASPIVYGDY